MNPTAPPRTGAYFWVPLLGDGRVRGWDIQTCHDLGLWDGISHREAWPHLIRHIAPMWVRDPEEMRARLRDHCYALPRGRITCPRGAYLLLHGNDAPLADWEEKVLSHFGLSGQQVPTDWDDHEKTRRADVDALEEFLGFPLGLT